jgi:hypothetical protein
MCLKYNFEQGNSERLLCVPNKKIPMTMNAADWFNHSFSNFLFFVCLTNVVHLTQLSESWVAHVTHKFSSSMELKFNAAITVIPKLVPAVGQMNVIHVFICYLRSILITCAHLRLGFPSILCPSVFPSYFLYASILCIIRVYCWSQHFRLFCVNSAAISGQSQVMRTASATECF